MRSLLKCYKETFSPVMKEMGFSSKGKFFHRLVGGKVVQLLGPWIAAGGREFDIQFKLIPLCQGGGIHAFMDSNFVLSRTNGTRDTWVFADLKNNEYEEQMPGILKQSGEFVFPYFQAAQDYQSTLTTLLELCEKCCCPPRFYYFLCIACGEYEMAIRFQKSIVTQAADAHASVVAITDSAHLVHREQEIKELESEFNTMVELIRKKDYATLKRITEDNERYSLESYRKNFGLKQ